MAGVGQPFDRASLPCAMAGNTMPAPWNCAAAVLPIPSPKADPGGTMRRSTLPFLLFAACAIAPANRYGTFHRPITTSSPQCQERFDEGLLLCYGFNHEESVVHFKQALQADPDCAMAWWGIAHALGPNINGPLTDKAVAAE